MDYSPELDSEAIRVRLRRHMGEYKISRSKLAIGTGINRASLATKLDGPVEFTVPEIAALGRALNKSWLWVMTGQDIDLGPGPGGGNESHPGESNPRPIHYE